jgi:hypothetical protein
MTKCNACMKIAEDSYRLHRLTKQYLYKLLREKCVHSDEEKARIY